MNLHVDRQGRGPDLVLLHGWGLHSGAWADALPALARSHRLHAIDLPGHGHSSRAEVGTLDEAADAVAAIIPEDAAVCGWSLGGLLAQRIARRHPSKVRRLALVSSTPCFVARADWPYAMQPATLDTFARGLEHERDATLENFVRLNALNGVGSRDAIRTLLQRLGDRGAPPEDALRTTLGWLREADLRADASLLSMPALVIHGARDALAPIAAGRWLAQALPAATLVEIADAAHLPFFSHRALFLQTLESFVA